MEDKKEHQHYLSLVFYLYWAANIQYIHCIILKSEATHYKFWIKNTTIIENTSTHNLPGQFLDKEIFDVEKTRILPQNKVHKCIVVVLSAQALLHLFHVNHSLNLKQVLQAYAVLNFDVRKISINKNGTTILLFGSETLFVMYLYRRSLSRRHRPLSN